MDIITDYAKRVERLAGTYSVWDIWNDFIDMAAIALAIGDQTLFEKREEQYMEIQKKYAKEEHDQFSRLFAILIEALTENPQQDVLGEVFSQLNIAERSKGQFFTPYSISQLMAKIVLVEGKTKEKGHVQIVNEPACGSGSMLIALANEMRNAGIDFQRDAYFVAQDISPLAAKMCFIQLALLGCPGVVIIGDALSGDTSDMEKWYMPMHFLYGISILKRYRLQKMEEINQKPQESAAKTPHIENAWVLKMVGIM